MGNTVQTKGSDKGEMLEVVDEHDRPTGFAKLRTEIHHDGDWHREAHVFVYNNRGELLYQLRSPDRESFPNCWDVSAGGHVEAGSDYLESAQKELHEELGLVAAPGELTEVMFWHDEIRDTVRQLVNRAWRKAFIYRFNGLVEDLHLEKGAIVQAKFFTEDEIMNFSEDYGKGASLIPGYKWYYQKVFDKVRGVLKR